MSGVGANPSRATMNSLGGDEQVGLQPAMRFNASELTCMHRGKDNKSA